MTTLFRSKLRTMFSKLRYSKTLVDSTINKFSQEPDKEIHTVPSVDPSVYIVLPFKDQRSADRVRKDIYSLGAKINVNVKPHFYKQKTVTNPECQGKQAPDRQHSMRCILISMWFVRCKLCRVHCPTLTSTHKWTPLFSHRETPWNTAWQQQNKDWPSFQSSEEM